MAVATKTLTPTNQVVNLPDMTEPPDNSVNVANASKLADAVNALNSKSTANVTNITNFTPNSAITLVKQGKVCYAYFAMEATSDINCTSDFIAIADIPSGFIPAENTANVLPIFYNSTFKSFQVRVSADGKFQLYGLNKLADGETIRGQIVYFVS